MKKLIFEQVTFGYRKDKPLFSNLSFEIAQPEDKGIVIGLMGASGSGKSTILKLILGIEKTYRGDISITPENPIVSYVPQEPVLFEHLTPFENAEYFSRINNYKAKFNRQLFDEVSGVLQIGNILKSSTSVNEISGGQKQRISLLRAMSIQPDVLLLDEPLTGMDEEVKDQFLQTLALLIHRFRLMVIYVTHHPKEAEFISDQILYLEKEQNTEVVSWVRQTDTQSFFHYPPTISALNATKRFQTNTLQFKQTEDGTIIPSLTPNDPATRLISFHEETIQFSNESGFEFEIAAQTGAYTLLKLKNVQSFLTIDNETLRKKSFPGCRFISLSGNANLYDSKGLFLRATEIKNNKTAI
ncbi:MAG: ABC transporter ATP-binding protein [Bacteroidetes bacterium]|nr:ABC transporter ATP-binding protein [Bacteroidota bacterium]